MMIQILVMCGKIVPRVLLIISYSKRVFYSSMFFYEKQLFNKLVGEVLLDTLEETKLWLLWKKISIGPS